MSLDRRKKAGRDLLRQGFEADLSWNDSRVVHVGWVRVSSLLREAGASGHPDQKLSIKLEVDTRPPAGAVCGRTVAQRHAVATRENLLSLLDRAG